MKSRLRAHSASPHRLPASISACIAVLISVALLPSPALAQSGDMNCDDAVNIADIPLFVDALLATGSFGGCDITRADMNADTLINGLDTQPFVVALLPLTCLGGTTLCFGVCHDLRNELSFCGTTCENAVACSVFETCTDGVCVPVEP